MSLDAPVTSADTDDPGCRLLRRAMARLREMTLTSA
jgi:hypothetical protein